MMMMAPTSVLLEGEDQHHQQQDELDRLKSHYKLAYELMMDDGDTMGADRATNEYFRLEYCHLDVGAEHHHLVDEQTQQGGPHHHHDDDPTILGKVSPLNKQIEFVEILEMCKRTNNNSTDKDTFHKAKLGFYRSLGLIPSDGMNHDEDTNSNIDSCCYGTDSRMHDGAANSRVTDDIRENGGNVISPMTGSKNCMELNQKNEQEASSGRPGLDSLSSGISNTTLPSGLLNKPSKGSSTMEPRNDNDCLDSSDKAKKKRGRSDDDQMGMVPQKSKRPPKVLVDLLNERSTKRISSTNRTKSLTTAGGKTPTKSYFGKLNLPCDLSKYVFFRTNKSDIPQELIDRSATTAYYTMIDQCVQKVISNDPQHATEHQVVDLVKKQIKKRKLHFMVWDPKAVGRLPSLTSNYQIGIKVKASVRYRFRPAIENVVPTVNECESSKVVDTQQSTSQRHDLKWDILI